MAKCILKDTDYCTTLGRSDCDNCDIAKMEDHEQEKIKKDVDVVRSLLPEKGVSPLFESETCLFCRNEPKGKREWYATTDFGHVEPRGTKSNIFGFKTKTKLGSMVPLQISCCGRCKKVYNISDMLTVICMGIAVVVCLLLLAIAPIKNFVLGINELAPLLSLIFLILIGYVVGKVITSSYVAKQSKYVIFDIAEIPYIAELLDRGWFSIYGDGKNRLIFSKERLKKGWFI